MVASGVRFRRLGIPGEDEAEGKWFFNHPALVPQPKGAGKTVVVLGGGDNAFSTAHVEGQVAAKVIVALRGEEPRAHPKTFLDAAALPNVAVRTGWKPLRFGCVSASNMAPHLDFATPEGEVTLPCDLAYACLGYAPNSEPFSSLKRDGRAGSRWTASSRPRPPASGRWAR